MARPLLIAALFVALTGCGQKPEKLCADAVYIVMAGNGAIAVNRKTVSVDELAGEIEKASLACGAKVRIYLQGYGAADREKTKEVVQIIETSKYVGAVETITPGEEP